MMDRHDLIFSSYLFHALFYNNSVKQNCTEFDTNKIYCFNNDELYKQLADIMQKNNYKQLKGHIENFVKDHSGSCLNFYDVLFDFSDRIMARCNNRYCFKYKYTDIWRNLTREIDEEIFVMATIVHDDLRRKVSRKDDFEWPFCIEHNNHEIKMLLQRDRGVSENHFHLRGSSPYFYISWVYLMNNPLNPDFEKQTDEIDRSHLQKFLNSENEYPLKLIWRKAAVIRMYLYCFIIDKLYPQIHSMHPDNIGELRDLLYKTAIPYSQKDLHLFSITKIQDFISKLNVTGTLDYAQRIINSDAKYFNFAGERFIIYNSLKIIYQKENNYEEIEKLLYLYLLMKHRFRAELVQSNSRVGFYNFSEYQNRKDSFIPWSNEFEGSVAADTISSMIDDTKLYRAELRISPRSSWQENDEYISVYEQAIIKAIDKANKRGENRYSITKDNFFYTFHFTKGEFKEPTELYRHYQLRQKIKIQAEAIFNLRLFHSDNIASRILGIDACASEIDCRPEVFASVIRYLLYYEPDEKRMDGKLFRQLKATYHVAEDNYDIADALRAIYETIFFLDLPAGSRIGHATLLGIPPEEYYNEYNNPITMPRQIFLDNVVWMYYFISKHNITFNKTTLLLSYLKEQYEIHFHKIFDDELQPDFVEDKLRHALDSIYLKFPSERKSDRAELCKFDMYHYYLSYLLRGDDPELYKNGYINKHYGCTEEYKICHTISKMESARDSFEASYLYYLYHYNERVKRRGMEVIEEKIPDYFIEALAIIQKYMKKIISDSGIAIETNPTSNMYISVIDDYAQHPISNFYDYELAGNPNDIQLNISINTDDKSVFSTCLSNEYAYLLYYLENKKDAEGKYLYSRFEILQWLDAVRKMGNEQSFDN